MPLEQRESGPPLPVGEEIGPLAEVEERVGVREQQLAHAPHVRRLAMLFEHVCNACLVELGGGDDAVRKPVAVGDALEPARLADGVGGIPADLDVHRFLDAARQAVREIVLDAVGLHHRAQVADEDRRGLLDLEPRIRALLQVVEMVVRVDHSSGHGSPRRAGRRARGEGRPRAPILSASYREALADGTPAAALLEGEPEDALGHGNREVADTPPPSSATAPAARSNGGAPTRTARRPSRRRRPAAGSPTSVASGRPRRSTRPARARAGVAQMSSSDSVPVGRASIPPGSSARKKCVSKRRGSDRGVTICAKGTRASSARRQPPSRRTCSNEPPSSSRPRTPSASSLVAKLPWRRASSTPASSTSSRAAATLHASSPAASRRGKRRGASSPSQHAGASTSASAASTLPPGKTCAPAMNVIAALRRRSSTSNGEPGPGAAGRITTIVAARRGGAASGMPEACPRGAASCEDHP